MKTQIELILATIPLTVLIWVYADLASHESYQVPLAVHLTVPANAEAVVQLEGVSAEDDSLPDQGDTTEVQITVTGPKSAISELDHEKHAVGLGVEVSLSLADLRSVGMRREVDIRELVNSWARQRGLYVSDLSRATITYTVDRFVDVDIDVEADPGLAVGELKGPPVVEPPKIKMRLLTSALKSQESAERRLVVPIEDLIHGRTDEVFEQSLINMRWQGLDVTFNPDRVTIRVDRRQDFTEERITAIPLSELWPAYRNLQGQYRIVWEDGEPPLLHINVLVPPGKPRPLTNKDVTAFVPIEHKDLEQAAAAAVNNGAPSAPPESISRPVLFIFAPGFEDVKVQPPLPTVRFRIEPVPALAPVQ